MDKKKLQLSVIIGTVAMALVVILLIGIILLPSGNAAVNSGGDKDVAPVVVNKYDVTGRIFDTKGNALSNTKFCISLGPTDFTTDDNGFFIFKNLTADTYTLSGYDSDGNRIGTTVVQLSNDGGFSVGNYTFEKGAVVTLCFDGEKFFAVIVNENPQNTEVIPAKEDETYTNFSWMKDIPMEYGAYHLDYSWNQELLDAVLADEDFAYFDTYIVGGRNPEIMTKSAAAVAKAGKKVWLNTYDLIFQSGENHSQRLKGDWREILNRYAAMLKEVSGDAFQGIYFDEPTHKITGMDFTRITQYCRETFQCRVWAVHADTAYLTPYYKHMSIFGFKPGRDDPFVINSENHKYVTDVGWWRYIGNRFKGDMHLPYTEFYKAMTMLDPNTRKWCVPPLGTYDWRHTEEDCLDVIYRMIDLHRHMPGFGGVMFYSFFNNLQYDAAHSITEEDQGSRLTENDYLKDENGNYILDENGKRIVHVKENNSPVNLPDKYIEGYGSYFIFDKLPDGSVRWPRTRAYVDIIGNGIKNGTSWNDIMLQLDEVFVPDKSCYKNEYIREELSVFGYTG